MSLLLEKILFSICEFVISKKSDRNFFESDGLTPNFDEYEYYRQHYLGLKYMLKNKQNAFDLWISIVRRVY